jgi:hypothetical protein
VEPGGSTIVSTVVMSVLVTIPGTLLKGSVYSTLIYFKS